MSRIIRSVLAVTAAVVILAALVTPDADASRSRPKKKKGPYQVSARSAVLLSGDRLRSIYDKDASRKVLPASTTKVMTALIALETLQLDDYVTISARVTATLPSKVDIKAGERYRVRDLLYAALLNSANDASIALAEASAGSEEAFVARMNRRARQIGAHNTLFANCHGLPSEDPQYTTAYDMALIFNEAMRKPFFKEAIQNKFWIIQSEAGRKIALRSHNKALFKGWKSPVYGKTGYTNAARACFVGRVMKDNQPLIIAVFGCSKRWDDVKYIFKRYGGVDL
ncbi:MAG: D-alanyl-D-alanine carboxypeptidase [Candidatus Omnitrophica bacterium]|nr:D-alanyl-D-alanine carboxypeptidase [Candidatus Omnitrophota bacterium]